MGVKGLNKILRGIDCTTATILADYRGKSIGIDASLAMYQWASATKLTSPAGAPTSHIVGMFYRTIAMLEAGITPIYVFDGPARAAKQQTLERRAASPRALYRGAASDCMQLLALMGVQFIVAPAEADAVLAALCRAGDIYAVASEDTDILAFGAPRLLRGFSATGTIEEYSLEKILGALMLTYEQFLHMCVMLGTDYGNPFHGIGPAKAPMAARVGIAETAAQMGVPPENWRRVVAEYLEHPVGDLKIPARGDFSTSLRDYLTRVVGMTPARVDTALSRV